MKNEIIERIESIVRQSSDDNEALHHIKALVVEMELSEANGEKASKSLSEIFEANASLLYDNALCKGIMPTGFANIDEIIGGFIPGELVVIGGRPGMGKTQFLINLALNLSLNNKVIYFSLDQSEWMITLRFISTLTAIPIDELLKLTPDSQYFPLIKSVGDLLSQHQIIINDSTPNWLPDILTETLHQIQNNDVKVIFIDYIQMVNSIKTRNGRDYEVSFMMRQLKSMAKSQNVCIIMSSQLSRSVEVRGGTKHPQLSDLRDSGSIEQECDKVFFLYRPQYYKIDYDENGSPFPNGLTELIIAKNRNGKTDTAHLMIDEGFTSFFDLKNSFDFAQSRLDELKINESFLDF